MSKTKPEESNAAATSQITNNAAFEAKKGKKRKRKADTAAGAELAPSSPEKRQKSQQSHRNQQRKSNQEARPQALPSNGNGAPHLLRRRDELLKTRKALPIWPHADSIREALRKNNVMVLTGETGSGKSTQVPQFLTSEPWCTETIAITQPRRVAAISLARRVAEEMGSLFGKQSPAAKVGYSVRFDNACGPETKVKFLTEGMLLQEILRDPEMNQYSAVVVDEVHERSVNVDLILGFLRNLVSEIEKGGSKRKQPLKVVIMSATADVEGLVKFFDEGFGNGAERSKKETQDEIEDHTTKQNDLISTCFVEGRQYPVKTHYLPEPTMDWVESALKIIFKIHYKEPLPGDILVFLTGQDKIESLEKLINDYAEGMEKEMPKLLPLPLFAALPQYAQQRIFEPTPRHARKVILATNIAETSVTVPGVRFVIDCGKSKIKQFRSKLGLESLLAKPVSKSASIQRKGRAGREAPGQCYRLYTEPDYATLEERTKPEILRCDLVQAILTMKARGVNDVLNFPFLDRPPIEALKEALFQLLRLGALKADGTVSDIGLKMSKLPVTPKLGRIILEAGRPERDCLLDVIDIISALSSDDSIFFNIVTEEKKEQAEEARRNLYRREGDHMSFLTTVQQYAEEHSDRRAWCDRHFVSHRAMQNVMNIRKQLRQQCQTLKLLTPSDLTADVTSSPNSDAILASLLRGFISNTARLCPDGSYKTFLGNHTVAIHPSSVLHGRKVKAEAIVFSEFLYTNKAYAKKVSAVQMNWIEDAMEEAFDI
ncbi:P-loop containing nucleoside triphosphate hydrolase protein [Massarina eburnea CBS 473.64]|uniref:RNA helicase n=1 Tax=Massarina eburnea CBS 473.64 TaxID=1395130 RepID=A0A6A6S2Q8_9PLEO|nr:P-loop containing nucleoside triphosphate hydrolase protein [Massarina eburnea CBS 473.64]